MVIQATTNTLGCLSLASLVKFWIFVHGYEHQYYCDNLSIGEQKGKKYTLRIFFTSQKKRNHRCNAHDPKNFVVAPKKEINSVRSNIRIFCLPYLSTKVSHATPLFRRCCCVRMSQRRNLLKVSGPIFSLELVVQATQSHHMRPCV